MPAFIVPGSAELEAAEPASELPEKAERPLAAGTAASWPPSAVS